MRTSGQTAARALTALEVEWSIVRSAIGLVASGNARRVECAGLRFAGQLLEQARSEASPACIDVVPVWSLDAQPMGLLVSKAADG
jgi:hypothetical protein